MPMKQTKESIEAELNAGDRERLARHMRELTQERDEIEKMLRQLEKQAGLPTSYRSKPLVERMAALGMSRASTDRTQMMIDAIEAIQSGRELSDLVKSELAAHADAELSGAELLAGIVQAHRKA
jgi:predicted translin family RNA/ssDNA-binding protein